MATRKVVSGKTTSFASFLTCVVAIFTLYLFNSSDAQAEDWSKVDQLIAELSGKPYTPPPPAQTDWERLDRELRRAGIPGGTGGGGGGPVIDLDTVIDVAEFCFDHVSFDENGNIIVTYECSF